MGVCCSPTELLLNKVVYVVVNQILLKLFIIINKPLGSVKFRAVQWSKPKPQKDVLSAGDDTNHRRARIGTEPRNISVYQCNQWELMSHG